MSFKSSEDQKKAFTAIWYYIRPELEIYSCFFFFFCLIIQTLTLNRERWNLDGGTLIFGGGHAPLTI